MSQQYCIRVYTTDATGVMTDYHFSAHTLRSASFCACAFARFKDNVTVVITLNGKVIDTLNSSDVKYESVEESNEDADRSSVGHLRSVRSGRT